MGSYSIKELETLSGIKAHTLRIWEKRYNLLEPMRTDTNIRYYSDEDLKKLLSISILTASGIRISELAGFSQQELSEAILEINDQKTAVHKLVTRLIVPMLNLDEKKFSEVFDSYVKEMGLQKTLIKVIHPFLERVGVLWLCGDVKPTQEHFVSGIIRQKLLHAIEEMPFPEQFGESYVLFLPEGEYHELGLIFFHYLLKRKGNKVYYIGQSAPLNQVIQLVEQVKPDKIIFYSVIKSEKQLANYFKEIERHGVKNFYYVENTHQEGFTISYPQGIKKVKGYKALLKLA
jgi:DNA-binding transcriptional MerR regulator